MRPVYYRATENMGDDASEADHGFVVLAQGMFDESVVLPPNDHPPEKITLLEVVRRFVAEQAGRPVAELKLGEIERFALPIKDALLDGRLQATCITRAGPYLDVQPIAFWNRQTWRGAFEPELELPVQPRVGIEPGYLVVDRTASCRFVTGFRAEKALDTQDTTYVPKVLLFAINAAHRLGIEGGRYSGPNLVEALRNLAKEDGFVLALRPAQNLARFMTNRVHFRDGWVSSTPPIFEFVLELIASHGVAKGFRFNRADFRDEIFNLGKQRPDLGIGKTHASFLSTFCGNPDHSKGGAPLRKPGSPETRLSRARRSAKL